MIYIYYHTLKVYNITTKTILHEHTSSWVTKRNPSFSKRNKSIYVLNVSLCFWLLAS